MKLVNNHRSGATGQKYASTSTPIRRQRRRASSKNVLLIIFLILVIFAAGFSGWYYWLTTHAVFEYSLQAVVILYGESASPDEFLYEDESAQNITAAFRGYSFNPTAGRQNVPLVLTRGLRTLETTAVLYALTPISEIHNEFTVPGPALEPMDFLSNANVAANVSFDVRFTTPPLPLDEYPVGEFPLYLSLNGAPFEVMLIVTDTTRPTAVPVDKIIKIGDTVVPEDFVTDVFDASGIASVSFVEEPSIIARHDQIVQIELVDYFGNYEIFSASLSVQFNEEPPVIEGAETIIANLGANIIYRRGLTAHDDFGRDLTEEINVDSSNVNIDEIGVYTVVFYVEDLSGLRGEVEVDVHVVSADVDPEYVFQRVDEALAGILTDGMTQLEQVQAIHTWVRRNVSYAAVRGGPPSVYEGAYRALQDRRGNCYIYFSISKVMLTRAGIPNMAIERIPGTPTRHLWNLVNPDELGWHHFDSFPTRLGLGVQSAFFTSSQARRFSEQIREINNMWNYYTYDPTLYPEIVQ